MPELPEVETVRRGLVPHLIGRCIIRVDVQRLDLRAPLPRNLAWRLTGRKIERLERRGKYLLFHLDDDSVLLLHLGMSGRLIIARAPVAEPGRHDHFRFETDDGTVVTFSDPRRFGLLDLVPWATLPTDSRLASLGPEPLSNAFCAPDLRRRLCQRRAAIKTLLLDQRLVAGLGNIYVSESLYRAGIAPERPGNSLTEADSERLVVAIRTVLEEAIAAGGSSLRDYVQVNGELGYFQHRFAVYDRAGLACPDCDCDPVATGGIRRLIQANRSTYYCPRRQG
ncbi:Formamidopyrimidine-DNA glycosylase [uncultured Gammaproteobacteria bacterium]